MSEPSNITPITSAKGFVALSYAELSDEAREAFDAEYGAILAALDPDVAALAAAQMSEGGHSYEELSDAARATYDAVARAVAIQTAPRLHIVPHAD